MKPKNRLIALAILALAVLPLVLVGCARLLAQPKEPVPEVASGDITQGSLRIVKDGKTLELPLKHTDVDARVTGYIGRVNVTQHFINPYDKPIEAVYVFPLPENSAVDAMTMKIGSRIIKGVIKKREEARKIYEDAKNQGKTASLLEQERPNIFTQSVANIMPGDDIFIEISYVQDLKYDHGTYEFNFPMVVGPRFIPGNPTTKQGGGWSEDTDQVPDASRITPPVIKPEFRSGHDISLKLSVEAGVPIKNFNCPSHKIVEKSKGTTSVGVEIAPGDRIPNKDFTFRYDVAGNKPEYALLTTARDGSGFFMLMIQPQTNVKVEDITPKEMVFVVDCSGSMSGFPVEKAKEAVKLAIKNMNPDDNFQIIKFSESAGGFAPAPVPNTPENVKKGLAYVDAMEGEGGTMMIEGIKAALDYERSPKRRRIVLFMTDGYIGNETEILAAIEERLGNARLFSFGVGSSVNHYLLDKMAQVGRGQVTYCREDENPQPKIQLFYERIAKPYLMDIAIDWNGLAVTEVFPERIPDLFSAQPVIIHGRYTRPGQAVIKLKGSIRSKPFVQEIPVVFPADEAEHDVIATLWARTKIERLMDEMFRGEDPKIVDQVTMLALEFKLMSKYTSFVAVEEKVRNVGGKVETVQVPIPIPEGVSYKGVFGEERDQAPGMGYGGNAPAPTRMVLGSAAVGRKVKAQEKTIAVTTPSASFETPTIIGTLDAEAVSESLEAGKPQLMQVYNTYRVHNANLAGRIVFTITVKADGTVESVTATTSTIGNAQFEKAIIAEIKKLRFPAPADGAKATITVPVVFTP
jgi:Ca-activated chloride channel family protein